MTQERREFFRISDQVVLDYRPIAEQEVEQLAHRIQAHSPDRFTTASSFAATSRQIAHHLHKVQTQSPELARCLQTIDQKLNTLAQLFVSEEMQAREQPSREVNLSGGGIAFTAHKDLPAGTLLEMRIVLLPSMLGILTVGKVVHCDRSAVGNAEFPWQVAVAYEHLRESDRELLVRHIMNKETRRLREEREQTS